MAKGKKSNVAVLDGTSKKPESKRVAVTKEIKVKLTDKKKSEMSKEAASIQKSLDAEEALLSQKTKEFKEFKKPQDKKIKELKESIAKILRAIECGEAMSTEKCAVVFDYQAGEVLTYFPENSTKEADIVERRTMDARERQLSLIPEEAEAVAGGIPAEGPEARE